MFPFKPAQAILPKSPTPEKKRKLEESKAVSFREDNKNYSGPVPSSEGNKTDSTSTTFLHRPSSAASDSSVSLGGIDTSSDEDSDKDTDLGGDDDTTLGNCTTFEEEEEDLTEQMSKNYIDEKKKKKSLGSSTKVPVLDRFQKLDLPHLLYTWKDSKRVDIVSLEIHLPSATIPSEYHMELEIKGGKQYFILKHTLSPAFIDQDAFEASLVEGKEEEAAEHGGIDETAFLKDLASHSLARSDHINQLKKEYAESTDVLKEYSKMKMKLELPFICEDIFDVEEYHGRYENTGHHFKTWMTLDDVGNEVRVDTLTVTLASRKREKTPIKINTPLRKQFGGSKIYSRKDK